MNKKKARLREKIRNRPNSRDRSKKKKTIADRPLTAASDALAVADAGAGLEVMSHVIMEFAGPLLETCTDQAAERKAISLAIFVWNAALLSEPECRQTLDVYLADCRKALPPEELNTLSSLIDQLVQSKRTRFADNRKKITNCTFGDFGDNRHIEVGYTME